jgi:hypothetical protein
MLNNISFLHIYMLNFLQKLFVHLLFLNYVISLIRFFLCFKDRSTMNYFEESGGRGCTGSKFKEINYICWFSSVIFQQETRERKTFAFCVQFYQCSNKMDRWPMNYFEESGVNGGFTRSICKKINYIRWFFFQ